MLNDVLKSLSHDKIRSFFCWLTYALTSMFIFLFFTVAMSDSIGVTMFRAASDLPSILMVASIILCSIEIIFSNDFFIKNKAKSLAVRLICGATYTQNAAYLLLQTLILICMALPVGIGCGWALVPVINQILSSVLNSDMMVAVSSQSIIWSAVVLGYVIFWVLILNLSFSYKNSAAQLLNPQTFKLPSGNMFSVGKISDHLMKIVHLLMFILPILMSYYDRSLVLICTIISLFGFISCLDDFIIPAIDQILHNKITDAESIISIGFFRNDLKVLKTNILLLVVSSTLLISLLTSTDYAIYQMLVLITYLAMSALLSLTVLFKYANETSERVGKFKTLQHIGYMEDQEKRIVRKEVFMLYAFITIVIVFYLVNIFATLIRGNIISIKHVGILMMGSVIPLVICGIISYLFYRRTIFK